MAALTAGIITALIGAGTAVSARRGRKKQLKEQEKGIDIAKVKEQQRVAESQAEVDKRRGQAKLAAGGRKSLISGGRATTLGGG